MKINTRNLGLGLACALVMARAFPADSQVPPDPGAAGALTYADMADLALAAPVVAHVRLARATTLKPEQATGVRAGFARVYIEAEIVTLIRSAEGLPSRVRYVADFKRDPKGKVPKPRKGSEFLVFARPVTGRADEIQLAAPDAQVAYDSGRADQVRAILREAGGAGAAPQITGIGRAFHVPGAIPGESETQIFLRTAADQPVSVSVLRRPGQTPFWAVALSEIVDDAASAPARDTLLWYRLACTLPRALPAQSVAEADAEAAAAIRADYGFVLDQLGSCARTRR
jgi:hypothetical protein